MKFKVGDKVRVKSTLSAYEVYGSVGVLPQMVALSGTILTIREVDCNNYIVEENIFRWSDEMLEPAYADEGYVPYSKIPTPEKPIPIEEQLGLPKGVSIHDLPTSELYNLMRLTFENGSFIEALPKATDGVRGNLKPVWIDKIELPEFVFDEKQAEKLAEEIEKRLANSGIGFKEEKKMATKFTFYVTEGTRVDKTCNKLIPTMTTFVTIGRYHIGKATCDKADYDERQGCLEAVANAFLDDNFDREFNRAVKANEFADKKKRTCTYCGQVFDTVEEKQAHEAWHVERKKARRERYLLRKRAKEIAFEEQAQKLAKEMVEK